MTKYKQGDIVLLPYPYTDLSNTKQRPVVIISKDSINNQNFIVAKITSLIRADSFSFLINSTDIDANLKYESEVRTNEIFTVHCCRIGVHEIAALSWGLRLGSDSYRIWDLNSSCLSPQLNH